MHAARTLAAAICAATVLAGCSSNVDQTAWKSDLAALGVKPADFSDYTQTWTDACTKDDTELRAFFTNLTRDDTDPEIIYTNLKHACPDRLADAGYMR